MQTNLEYFGYTYPRLNFYYSVFKGLGSTGGFLRRGSTTLMCGISASQVDRLSALVKEHCQEREEMVPLQGLPLAGDAAFSSRIVQIRTGGAVIFILPVERFFKT